MIPSQMLKGVLQGSVLAILLQTVITHVTDRSSRLDSIGMIKILTLLLAAGVFAVLLIGEKSAALTIAYVGVIHPAYRPCIPSSMLPVSSWRRRACRSITAWDGAWDPWRLAVSAFVLGYLVVWFQPEIVLYLALVNLALLTLVIFATGHHYKKTMSSHKDIPKNFDPAKNPARQSIGMLEFMRRNRLFAFMSLGIIALFFGNVIQENFTLQIVQGIGGDTSDMGRCDLAPLRL